MNKIYTGTGFINDNVLDKMIKDNENIVIIDSSSVYLKNNYNRLKNEGYNIKILNLKDYSCSDLFNILEYPYYLYKKNAKDESANIVNMLSNIITFANNGSDPFWSESAASLLTGIILALFEDGKNDEINLRSVYKMLDKINEPFNNSDKLSEYFLLKSETNTSRMYANLVINFPFDTKISVASVARAKLSIFINDFYNHKMSKSDIKIKNFEKEKQVLFITGYTKNTSAIVSIFISELLYSHKMDFPKCNIIINNLNSIDYIINLEEALQTSQYNNVNLLVNIGSKKLFKENYKLSSLDNLPFEKTVSIKPKKSNIVYPKVNSKAGTNWFDIDKYFKDNNIVNEVNTSVEDLLKEVDKKIKELESKKNA